MDKIYYFASPYSDESKLLIEQRYVNTIYHAGELIKKGFCLIEPIGMSHPVAQRFDLNTTYEYWKTRDRLFISRCDGVIVLTLPGWNKSIGVTDELAYARELKLDIKFYCPDMEEFIAEPI